MSLSSLKVGGLAGFAFIGTFLAVNVVQGSSHQPMAGASRSEVVEHYADAGVAADLGTALAPLAWLALLLFAGGVVAALRTHERASGESWSLVGLVGAVMQNALFAGVVATQAALATGSLSADTTWAVWQLHNALFSLNAMSLCVVLLALSVGARRAGLIVGWQRTLGLAAATLMGIAAVATPAAVDGHPIGMTGFAAFLLWIVWVLVVSTRLLRVAAPASHVDVPAAALAGAR